MVIPMSAYLVRIKEGKDIVGIFVCEGPKMLFDLVDECTSPVECEYTTLPSGGIYWPGPAVEVPFLRLSSDELEHPGGEFDFTESWSRKLFDEAKWKDIPRVYPWAVAPPPPPPPAPVAIAASEAPTTAPKREAKPRGKPHTRAKAEVLPAEPEPQPEPATDALPGDWGDYLDRMKGEFDTTAPNYRPQVIDTVADAILGHQERGEISDLEAQIINKAWSAMTEAPERPQEPPSPPPAPSKSRIPNGAAAPSVAHDPDELPASLDRRPKK